MKLQIWSMVALLPTISFGLANVVLAAKPDVDGTGKITLSCNIKEEVKKYSDGRRDVTENSRDYSGTIALNLSDSTITFVSDGLPPPFKDKNKRVGVSPNAISMQDPDGGSDHSFFYSMEIDRGTGVVSGHFHVGFDHGASNELSYSGKCTKAENNAF